MGICKNAETENHNCINSDRCANNQPITQLIVKDESGKVVEKFEVNDSTEKPMPMPPTFLSEKKKSRKAGKTNTMPTVVGNEDGKLGYGSTSIKTGKDNVLGKMRECETQNNEQPLVMPAVVSCGKK